MSGAQKLCSDKMRRMLAQCSTPASVRELSNSLGVHLETARSYMERAVSYGWAIKLSGAHPRYQAIPGGIDAGRRRTEIRIVVLNSVFALGQVNIGTIGNIEEVSEG